MADDTSKQGAGDRAQVAAGETYEVDYFAKKHGLTRAEAKALIDRVGNDRAELDAAADAAKPGAKPSAPKSAAKTPAPRRRAASSATASGATRRGTPATASARPRTAAKAVAPAAVAAVTEPIAKAIAPARKRVADTAASVATGAGKATRKARDGVSAAPAAARKAAGRVASKVSDGVAGSAKTVRAAAGGRTAALLGAAAAGIVTGLAVNLGRKAIVQAPSVIAGDWLEALKVEHRMALSLFDLIEATSDAEPAKRTLLLVQLKHALGKHAFTEENVVYPALRDWGDKADADKLNHDHGYVKQYLYDLEALEYASPAFLAKVADFRADLEAHIREEEDSIFPPLHAGLGEAGNAKLTALANKEGFKLA